MKKLLLTLPLSVLLLASCGGNGTSTSTSSTTNSSTTPSSTTSTSTSSSISSTSSISSSVISTPSSSESTSTSTSTNVSSSTSSSSSSSEVSSSTSSSSSSEVISSSSSSSSSSTTSSSSSSAVKPDVELPTTIDELKNLVSSTSASLSALHESSYDYNQTSIKDNKSTWSAEKRVTSLKGNLLSSKHLSESGTFIKYGYDSSSDEYTESQNYPFKTYNGLYNDENISLVVSNTEGVSGYITNYESSISKNSSSVEESLVTKTIQLAKSSLNNFTTISDPVIAVDGSFTYTLTAENELINYYDDKTSYSLNLEFAKTGFITKVVYSSTSYAYDWNSSKHNDYFKNYEETTVTATYADTLSASVEGELNPRDYITSSAELYLYVDDGYDEKLDKDQVKVGTTKISVKASSYTPSTSLDTTFAIVESSNTDVISADSYGRWNAVGVGTTNLKVRSDFGFETTITVTTYTPSVTSFTVSGFTSLFVDESQNLYVYQDPYDAVATYTVTPNVEGIVEVKQSYTDTTFSVKGLSAGTVTLHFVCNEKPELTYDKTIEVKAKLTEEEILAKVSAKSWTTYDYYYGCYVEVTFNTDGTGTIKIDTSKEIEITWTFADGVITVSEFQLNGVTYVDNKFTVNSDVTRISARCYDEYQNDSCTWDLR